MTIRKKSMEASYKACFWSIVGMVVMIIIALLFCSCTKTEYITVEKVRTDTTYINKVQRDSIYLHDSTFVKVAGDTVWIEQGWLRVAPGEVFDSMHAINELAAIVEQGINIVSFGYDPAQSIQPINQLKAWLQTLFQKRQDVSAAEIAKMIQKMVVPVPQTMMVQNPRILEIEEMIKRNDPFISFSESPLWSWCFGNCAVEVNDSTNLRRITKGGPAPSHKIDPIHALMDAVYLFDLDEGRVEQ